MSLWLHSHDGEDYLSEAGAMNVWIIKEAADGCEWFRGLQLNLARLDPLSLTLPLPSSVVDLCGSRRLV
jgi:branched-chain amino acid aminotransferase